LLSYLRKIAFKNNYKDLLQGQGFDIQGQGHENCPRTP